MTGEIVLSARSLTRHYQVSSGLFRSSAVVKALDGVSFDLHRRRTLAVVGESGCGKSTLARVVTMIEKPTAGVLEIGGVDVSTASAEQIKALRPKVQIVFQDPYGSLNPRQKIGDTLAEPLAMNTSMPRSERMDRAREIMKAVGLRPEHASRYPHMFSGGQRQRIAIARALVLDPDILVLDEPVSALDVSIQAQVLNLLHELQEKHDLAYLFISHDLSVVRHIADEVMVMYLGEPVEHTSRDILFDDPKHPYTRALLSSTPVPEPGRKRNRIVLKGELPSPINPPAGCPFHTRCPEAFERCFHDKPEFKLHENTRVSCHLYDPQ